MRKALAGLLVAACGCADFTLVEPGPGRPTQATMSLLVRADRSDSSRYQISGFFFPGLDTRGRVAEVADRALYVDDRPLQPTPRSDFEFLYYEWEETRRDGGVNADSVRLRLPVLADPPSGPVIMTVPISGREGPAEATWAEGQDLRLRVSPDVGLAFPFAQRSGNWTLELGDACEGSVTVRPLLVQGVGPHPAEFRVPWEWLAGVSPAPGAACLRVFSHYGITATPYLINVLVDLRLAWRVSVGSTALSTR